ncbi:MAG: hypothetical protein ABI277_18165 [Burkholderiaceae bacterium]
MRLIMVLGARFAGGDQPGFRHGTSPMNAVPAPSSAIACAKRALSPHRRDNLPAIAGRLRTTATKVGEIMAANIAAHPV